MEKFNENEGVWRTIRGRRVFIRKGASLAEAMQESGKFKDLKRKDVVLAKQELKNRELHKQTKDMEKAYETNRFKFGRTYWGKNWRDAMLYESRGKDFVNNYDNGEKEVNVSRTIDYNAKTRAERYKNYNSYYDRTNEKLKNDIKSLNDTELNDVSKGWAKLSDYDDNDKKLQTEIRKEARAEKRARKIASNNKAKTNKEYEEYKQSQIYPEDYEKSGKSQSEWRELDKKYSERYNEEINQGYNSVEEAIKGNEQYKNKPAYDTYKEKFKNTWGEDGSGTNNATGKMYTNDEFMEHLTDANWHTERKMLEEANLTNRQLSYIKDNTKVGAWSTDLDKSRTEQLINEAKLKYPETSKAQERLNKISSNNGKYASAKHEGFGDYNKDNIPVYDNKIDYTGDFGRNANLKSLTDDELTTALNTQSRLYKEALNEKLGDQRTRNGKMDKIFNTAKRQQYEEGSRLISEEMERRNMPRYNMYDKKTGMLMASSPTKEIADRNLSETMQADKSLQKTYGWKELPEYDVVQETPKNETKAKVNLGKIDYYGNGRKSNAVDIEMELKDGRFSASGNIWNSRHTDIVSGGQNIDEIAEHFKGNKDVQEIHSLWKQYHLNDMHAGTQKQEEALMKKFGNRNASDYDKHVEYLKSQGLYEDNGYRYGSGWLKWDIPKQDEQRIQSLINKYSKSSNNTISSSTNMKTTNTGAKVQKSAMDNVVEQFRNKKQSNVGIKSTSGTTKLEPIYDSRKSFYGKAEVKQSGDLSELYSYGTLVAQKGTDANGTYYKSMGKYSQTTTRHQKEFFKQSGLTDEEIKQIMKNGNLKKYNK